MAQSPAPAGAAGTVAVGDRPVNRLGFGAMRITGRGVWGPPRDHDEAVRVLRRAVDLGVGFIDTADSYGPEVSEQLIAEALAPYPEGLVIATKGDPVVEAAGRDGFAFIPWAPVGGHEPGEGAALAAVAERHGVSPVQVALAWQLARSPQMLPIPGTSSIAHLEQNVAAAGLVLDDDDLATLAA
jgi:aryl-alcohol dehydrogenase-like predicted oxidoreductase